MTSTYKLSYTGSEIDYRLSLIDDLRQRVYALEQQELAQKYFYFANEIDEEEGRISLKTEYSASGQLNSSLPKHLVIPDKVNSVEVKSLSAKMFENNLAVEEITLSKNITEIPERCYYRAKNLKKIYNTDNIVSVGFQSFSTTQIEHLDFPNLTQLTRGSFAGAFFLKTINIGNVQVIPDLAFSQCCSLTEVKANQNINSVGTMAFLHNRALKDTKFLSKNHNIELKDYAFFGSSVAEFDTLGSCASTAFPSAAHIDRFWENPSISIKANDNGNSLQKFSQQDPAVASHLINNVPGFTYEKQGCTLMVALHVFLALGGTLDSLTDENMTVPEKFVEYLATNGLQEYLPVEDEAWNTSITAQGEMYKKLFTDDHMPYATYEITVNDLYANAGEDAVVNFDVYKEIVSALQEKNTYVCTHIVNPPTYVPDSTPTPAKIDHEVVLYGIEESGDVKVLDSTTLYKTYLYQEKTVELDIASFTYTLPYQNLVGPESGYIIVRKK